MSKCREPHILKEFKEKFNFQKIADYFGWTIIVNPVTKQRKIISSNQFPRIEIIEMPSGGRPNAIVIIQVKSTQETESYGFHPPINSCAAVFYNPTVMQLIEQKRPVENGGIKKIKQIGIANGNKRNPSFLSLSDEFPDEFIVYIK